MNEKLQNAINIVKDIENIEAYASGEKVEALKEVVEESLKFNSQISAKDLTRRELLKAIKW